MFLTVTGSSIDIKIQKNLTSIHINEWLSKDVFRIRWCILLVFLIVCIYVWWKMLNKSRLYDVLLYAGVTTVLTLAIVEYGEELTLWDYPTDIIPLFPPFTSFNLAILPLIYSLVYQNFRTWKGFILSITIATATFCFIFEPLSTLGGFYQLFKWKYCYNFPIFLAMALLSKLIILEIQTISSKAKRKI